MDHTTERMGKVVEELTRQFGERLRGWMEEIRDTDAMTLDKLEDAVRGGMQSLGKEALQGLVEMVGTGKSTEPLGCPRCGKKMTFVRYQRKWVQTLLGAIRPERAYYHCAECRQGHVPLDHQLGLGSDSLSGELEQALCLLVARMPLEETADTLQRLLRVKVDDNTVQRAALRVGSELAARQERRAEEAWQASKPPEMEAEEAPERLYISVDGTTAHLQEGWKEVKVAAIYETEALPQADGTIGIKAVRITYVVSFEDAQTFARHVYLEAARRGLEQAQEVVVLGDGAEWIWNRIARFCDRPVEIVDFYHASEHVWNAGQALYGEGTEETERWVTQRLDQLLQQGPEAVIASFKKSLVGTSTAAKAVLARESNYLHKHKRRMQYPTLRTAGYHIGSGSVESACKRIIGARLKQAGMIWTRVGAEAIAQLRATILCNRWDAFWGSYDRSARTSRLAA
jgi:transposase-like protein